MEKDIGKLKKNDNIDIVVRIDDFGGKPGLTIREYTTSERYTGFTKSGTRISPENFKKFKEIINSIDENDLPVEVSETPDSEQETLDKASESIDNSEDNSESESSEESEEKTE